MLQFVNNRVYYKICLCAICSISFDNDMQSEPLELNVLDVVFASQQHSYTAQMWKWSSKCNADRAHEVCSDLIQKLWLSLCLDYYIQVK